MSKKLLTLIILLILLIVVGAGYYWLVYRGEPIPLTVTEENPNGFNPFNRNTVTPPSNSNQPVGTTTKPAQVTEEREIPTLRLISATPVGGFSASTTASTTVVRYVDRGAGHIFEAYSDREEIEKLSNTTLPRIYESYWNKNLNAVILRYIKSNTDTIVNFYGEIRPTTKATSTDPINTTPYEVRGKFLSAGIDSIAVSPKGDRVFTLNIEDGRGIGYISGFDESKKTKILDIPLTQLSIAWPEENTAIVTTKASGMARGYVYSLNITTGLFQKIMGDIVGLTTKASTDAKRILFSNSANNSIKTSVFNISESKTASVIFKTLPEKCVWSNINKNDLYCAVPVEIPSGTYPDDWYRGKISFIDQIWHLDTNTGEVNLLANLLNLSNKLIDAVDLTLDKKEDYLYFINKNDLSLWSLDLTR